MILRRKKRIPRVSTKSEHKKLKAGNDKLWAECVKAAAGYKSELSGKEGILHAHHLNGKANYLLRYHLNGGMCLTAGEHKFLAHNPDRYEEFRRRVKELRGNDIYEKLESMKHWSGKTDLRFVKAYLKQTLEELKRDEKCQKKS